ncbi:MAG: hypothetical protein JW904_00430 [Spirochaetales bacterium]|nr:hypothetical protein [Spirochaetales bacterium]
MRICRQIIIIFLILFLSACGNGINQLHGTWFFLKNGKFVTIENIRSVEKIQPVAWQHQERISDIALFHNKPVFLINSQGVVIRTAESGHPEFTYEYNDIFKNRTATLLLPGENSIFCHLYYDKAFRNDEQTTSPSQPLCFVKITFPENDSAVFEPFQSVFHRRNGSWEAVAAYAFEANSAVLELKRSENDYTQFGYTLFDLKTENEEEKTKEWFTESFQLNEYETTLLKDKSLAKLLEKSIEERTKNSRPVILHFAVRDQMTRADQRIRYATVNTSVQVEFEKILIVRSADQYTALLPDGKLFVINRSEVSHFQRYILPALPDSCEYTSFAIAEGILYILWEETDKQDFYKIRGSGFLQVSSLPDSH